MIKSKNGHTHITGTDVEVFADLTTILRAIKNALRDEKSEEEVKEQVLDAVDCAFLSDEKLSEKIANGIGISPKELDSLTGAIAEIVEESGDKADEVLRLLGLKDGGKIKWN